MDPFARLGLPRSFALDLGELERQYLARSRETHPDFHGLADAATQSASLADTAAINEAYSALRDPLRRAESLLALHGGPTAQEEKTLDQTFLMEMMELREAVEEADGNVSALAPLEADIAGRERAALAGIAGQFAALQALPPGDARHGPALAAIRRALNGVKTVRSLLRDVRESL